MKATFSILTYERVDLTHCFGETKLPFYHTVEKRFFLPQCGNFLIFLSLRFFVKSILEYQEIAVLAILGDLKMIKSQNPGPLSVTVCVFGPEKNSQL